MSIKKIEVVLNEASVHDKSMRHEWRDLNAVNNMVDALVDAIMACRDAAVEAPHTYCQELWTSIVKDKTREKVWTMLAELFCEFIEAGVEEVEQCAKTCRGDKRTRVQIEYIVDECMGINVVGGAE